MTVDARRGRRGSGHETARAIPTGKRERPASTPPPPTGQRATDQRPGEPRRPARQTEEPRTQVMPVGTPPSRPARQDRGPAGGGPGRPGPGGPGGPRGPRPEPARKRRRPGRIILAVLLVIALVWAGGMVWAIHGSWSEVNKVEATPEGDRPSSEGRNVLLVGSDSREGLNREERNRLGTGHDTGGARTDSILVLHTGGGESTLMSIPRDSYVEIPGNGMNKINASFTIGGPKLLTQTIEQNTGLKIDGYMEIGFGGFAQVVDSVDGVNICVKDDMKDEQAHIDLKKGCQDLDGKNALGYVRARYSDPEGDLGRAKRQRQFLGALSSKMMTPSNVLLPWRAHSLGTSSASTLTVGDDDSMIGTGRALWAFRGIADGKGNSVTVPISDNNLETPEGSAVQWDEEKSKQLFKDLDEDNPISVEPDDS